jgi:beta-galactosidase
VVHDFALIYLEDKLVGTCDRSKQSQWNFELQCSGTCKLYVIVEAMGHINYNHNQDNDRKGLMSFTEKQGATFSWNIYKIPLNEKVLEWRKIGSKSFPALSRAVFDVSSPADTYLNVKGYKKGYLWVNDRNLGRYWEMGPSFKLFCPGVWLKKG